MKGVICPFCGVVSDGPHESEEACIAALQSEIDQTRKVLENVTEPLPSASIAEEHDPQLT